MHTYIQSRFYRSPEVVLGMHYSTSIDIWSFGCVAVELITGHALFPADNEHDLILFIAQSLGLPPTSMIQTASRRKTFFGTRALIVAGERRLTMCISRCRR